MNPLEKPAAGPETRAEEAAPPRPLWRDEFSVLTGEERYVNRRQFGKFLALASLGMFAGNLWILLRARFAKTPPFPRVVIANAAEIPVGGARKFHYPTETDPCLLIRIDETTFVAYSQKCTHLSCAVVYSNLRKRIECPCHQGVFAVADGSVVSGPPPRPLPRVLLERKGTDLLAVGLQGGEA
ncbi:MAG: Rieske 2Fe-2S domain-containing protein [Acidobacteriota bacterium]